MNYAIYFGEHHKYQNLLNKPERFILKFSLVKELFVAYFKLHNSQNIFSKVSCCLAYVPTNDFSNTKLLPTATPPYGIN